MLNDFKNKFSLLRKKSSLVHKLDSIKNSDQHSDASQNTSQEESISSENAIDADKLEIMQEETINKIDEILNSKAETINANAESVKSIENKMSKIDISISTIKRDFEENNARLDKMEENILELLSLYEVVSNSVNPFVGDNENKPIHLEQFETIEHTIQDQENKIEQLYDYIKSFATVSDDAIQQVREDFDDKLHEINKTLTSSASHHAMEVNNDIDDLDFEQETPTSPDNLPVTSPSNNAALLESLNNGSKNSIVLLNWVEFLMEKVGRNNLVDVLDYYIDIGWISEKVSNKIISYASGIDYYDEKPTWKLMPQDHTKSLMFIEQLRGKKIDMGTFNMIERNVEKVKHHSEPYFEI